jgi:NAD(P)-dependent dehydrogenase (short-subunit alcohol dehydrogenase family)
MSFNARSTADEVLADIDLSGKTVLVTGASGGIGLEAARAMGARGATVVLAARDQAKLDTALAGIAEQQPDARVEGLILDLASLASVRGAAAEFMAKHDTLDILINNAGVMCTPLGRTADGFETQFGTNHLGHFLFTNLVLPAVLASGDARIVNLSSSGHSMGTIDFDDPNFERRPYDGWASYGQSKTANILFSVALDERLAARGVRSFAVHPGGIRTDLGRYMSREDRAQLGQRIADATSSGSATTFEWKTIPQGAATSVWAATSPDLRDIGGRYCEDCQLAPLASAPTGPGYQPYAVDPDTARRLWVLSERLVGQDFA